jgi:hypothetical protein
MDAAAGIVTTTTARNTASGRTSHPVSAVALSSSAWRSSPETIRRAGSPGLKDTARRYRS